MHKFLLFAVVTLGVVFGLPSDASAGIYVFDANLPSASVIVPGPLGIGPDEVPPLWIGPDEVPPLWIGPDEVPPLWIGPDEVPPLWIGPDEVPPLEPVTEN